MSLKIQYSSDLHLEFELNRKWISKYPMQVVGDVLLMAGDIVPFVQIDKHEAFFDMLSTYYNAVYWIPGNHEYYGSDIAHRSGILNEKIRDNVFLVNNVTISIDEVDIICSTLWSSIDVAFEWEIKRAMADFHVINSGQDKLSIDEYNQLHTESRSFLEGALKASKAMRKIIMTHHVPTFVNYPEKYKGDVLNQAFATELYELIVQSGVDYWIYGHTHYNTPDFRIGKTHLVSNQLGYVKYGEHSDFNRAGVLKF